MILEITKPIYFTFPDFTGTRSLRFVNVLPKSHRRLGEPLEEPVEEPLEPIEVDAHSNIFREK